MSNNCDLCCKLLNGIMFDLRHCKSQYSGVYLISLIKNVGNIDCIPNIHNICKECNDLLVQLDFLTCRLCELQNVVKQYIEKRQQFVECLIENKPIENVQSNSSQDQIQDFKLFEEIVKKQTYKEEFTDHTNDYSNSVTIDHNELENKKEVKPGEQKNNTNTENPQLTCHCSKTFRTRHGLQKHLRSHSSETLYVCELCGQSYRQKASFKTHKKIHEGLYPFSCVYCNKTFTQKIALVRHIPMHTGKYNNHKN